ncbi:MAG: hypothetical protein OHK0021_15610 [Bryobacter sp.]
MRFPAALAAILFLAGCAKAPNSASPTPPIAFGKDFWETWGDGHAEISTYEFVIPRYGEPRQGESILIFVPETHLEATRVKNENPRPRPGDVFSAMKIVWQRNFQTGIYDYSEMLTGFLGLAPSGGRRSGELSALMFSRQEWCGQSFTKAVFHPQEIRVSGASYFEGESDLSQTLETKPEAMSEDGLVFWARQMSGPWLKPGETKAVPFLTGLRSARDARTRLAYSQINLTRLATLTNIEVPAGEFIAETWAAQLPNGRSYLFYVEQEAPHRLLRWQFTSGEKGELVATERLKYWEMTGLDDQEELRQLGLEPRAPRFLLELDVP